MKNTIELTKDNIKEINYEDIIAVTIAESGAMGEPNGFYAVDKNLNVYHLNFYFTDIDGRDIVQVFPLLKTFKCFFGYVKKLDEDWNSFNMGYGNYLIVRKSIYYKVNLSIEKILGKNWMVSELYKKWYDVIKDACK